MNNISVEDRVKIQSHLAEIWKILYANGLEDLEMQRTPNSKQKRHMCELSIKYNKNHAKLTDGFKLNVSDDIGCWRSIDFEATQEETDYWKRRDENANIQFEVWKRKQKRKKELENDHIVAYWHKHFMTQHWESENSSIWHFEQAEDGSRTFVRSRPNDFVRYLYRSSDADGKPFSKEDKLKYMKRYGLDDKYDLDTGYPIKQNEEKDMPVSEPLDKKLDKAKLVKDYLRKKFEDGSWKNEAPKVLLSKHEESIDEYLDTVREFIKQQEEYNLHGMALYGINEERTKAHEALLKEYGFDGYDEKSELARDVTKSFDFVGECKIVCGQMKTLFWSMHEASLRLAYALDVVEYADEYLKDKLS